MPELPEVETVRLGIEKALLGRTITEASVRRKDLRVPFTPGMAGRLVGRRLVECGRRAKYILLTLDDGQVMLLHLGMSGRVLLPAKGQDSAPGKHDHMILTFDDGARMVFHDPRRFGVVLLFAPGEDALYPGLAQLGPEPLERAFTGKKLAAALAGRGSDIKAALLDQKIVAGLGNIYVSEALFHAGISPLRKASSVTAEQAGRLVTAIRKVLRAALASGGSSLRDYRKTDGELGYFQHQFSVYDREGKACPGCNCDVARTGGVQRIVQSGRSTYFCPRRQD